MDKNDSTGRGRFWALWVALSAIGYSFGFLLGFVGGHVLLGNVMIGISIGAGVGLMQFLLLRRVVEVSAWWIAASMAGMALSLSLYSAVHAIWGYPFDLSWPLGVVGWALALAVGGAVTGLLQLRVLGANARTTWWVLGCTIGWGLSALGLAIPADMSGDYSGLLLPLLFIRNGMLAPAAAGIILGAVTAVTLSCIFSSTSGLRVGSGRSGAVDLIHE